MKKTETRYVVERRHVAGEPWKPIHETASKTNARALLRRKWRINPIEHRIVRVTTTREVVK